jgi:NAD(P)-dependent dehydrogenase (short-subunit alcohol dehydrogenase family)
MAILSGKTIIVTGSTSGIGRACALRLGIDGANVVCGDIVTPECTANEIIEKGGHALAQKMDTVSLKDWKKTLDATLSTYGEVFGLINDAAIAAVSYGPDTLLELPMDQWDRMFNINVKGYWFGMRTVIPSMIANGGGRIVNIASVSGMVGVAGVFGYSATKGAVIAMTRQAAVEYGKQGILINSVSPGTIATSGMLALPEEYRSVYIRAHVLPRLGDPDEVAAFVELFFTSPGGSFLTGGNYVVDGGFSAQARY